MTPELEDLIRGLSRETLVDLCLMVNFPTFHDDNIETLQQLAI